MRKNQLVNLPHALIEATRMPSRNMDSAHTDYLRLLESIISSA